ncbi:Endonuclease/exonuclease/phosphatase, partial [Mycena floridula]
MYRTAGTATYAAMNINGKKGDSINDSEHKWRNIRDLMMMNKVAALAILETKMTDEQIGEIEQSIYGKDLEIFTTTGDNPNSGGVAVVFNKLLTNTKGITSYEIIPGRALCITHPWHGAETEVILAVYAPTEKPQNGKFYQEIMSIWRKYKLPTPTKIMGDMNVTVDMLDRLPHKLDKKSSRDAHIEFRNAFDMNDGWRNTHPQTKEYTYSRINKKGEARQSRIDRIYTSTETQIRCRQWHIRDWAGGIGDHRLVSVDILAQGTPFQGKGRYSMQLHSMEDKRFMESVEATGCILQKELEMLNNGLGDLTEPHIVPQMAWHVTKSDWLKMEKERCKLKTGTDRCKKEKLEKERKALGQKLTSSHSEEVANARLGAELQSQIDIITSRQRKNRKTKSRLKRRIELDTLSKATVTLVKEPKTRNAIQRIRIPGSNPPK